jgi:phage-related holin
MTHLNPTNAEYLSSLAHRIFQDIDVKLTAGVILSGWNYLIDPTGHNAALALLILIVVDWAFGIGVARKKKDEITSAKFLKTPIKIGVYFSLVSSTHIAEYAIPEAVRFLDDIMVASLVMTELLSILEKAGRLGYAIPKRLLNQIEHLRDGDMLEPHERRS